MQERNIILAKTYEYRYPSDAAREASLSTAAASGKDTAKIDMTSRFLGLVVVPGAHITRIEVEERAGS